MSVKLLLSQPAGGKTSFCIDEIHKIHSRNPMAPVKVIVPDKMQMAYWKQTLSRYSKGTGSGSGFIGTEIISFSKLAMEILNKTSDSLVLIPSRLENLCIREAIHRANRKHPFAYFEPISEKPGLVSVIEQTIHMLLHGCITPDTLENASCGDSKTEDTARIYREYLEILQENKWTGAAGLLSAVADLLRQDRTAFPHCPLLVVDGFAELTNDCLELLHILTQNCDNILITLPVHHESDTPTDRHIMENAHRICSKLNAEIIYPGNYKQTSEILQLTDRVFYPSQQPSGTENKKTTVTNNALLMIEASSVTTEVREALRELKRRIKNEKLHISDCAVFVPDMAAYSPIFRQFSREMGIPLRFSQKQSLSESPAASALKRLLHLYPDFDTVNMLSVLRLPFFAGCPDPEDSSGGNYSADLFAIDQIGRKMNVINGTEEWESAFNEALNIARQENKKKDDDDTEDSDEGKVYEYPEVQKLERIKKSFLDLTNLLIPPSGLLSRAEWINWLEALLKTIHFYEQIEDPDGKSFESDFKNLLKRIVFCEEKLCLPPTSYEDFLYELESEIEAAVQTEQEYAGEHIFVGDISQTSGCRWKLIIFTGFAEGTFPRKEHEELILTNELRTKLGLLEQTDQQLLFRHALTRSNSGLIITRPQKTDKGEEWPPSIFWQTIRENLEENANLLTVTENMPVAAASPEELAFRLARGGIRGTAGTENDHLQKVQKLLDAAWKQLELLREQTKGIYSPEGNADLQAVLSDPVKDAIPYSCSAIETWLTCPFKYFLMKKLKLEQPQQPGTGTDAAQVGSMNHKVMELTFAPGTIYDSKEEALSKAEKNIEKVFKDAPREFGFRESELWEFEKDKLKQKLLETIDRMFTAARSKMPVNDSWMSVGTEMKFGYPKEEAEGTKPLTVNTEAGPIRIRGIIDRIDRRNDGLMRVVDYKTSFSSFNSKVPAAGYHIQAGIYAAAVIHAMKLGTKCEGMYWSINDKSVREYVMYDSEEDGDIPNLEYLNQFTAGIRDASFKAESAGGDCPDYCPAAPWCRKYVRREYYG